MFVYHGWHCWDCFGRGSLQAKADVKTCLSAYTSTPQRPWRILNRGPVHGRWPGSSFSIHLAYEGFSYSCETLSPNTLQITVCTSKQGLLRSAVKALASSKRRAGCNHFSVHIAFIHSPRNTYFALWNTATHTYLCLALVPDSKQTPKVLSAAY